MLQACTLSNIDLVAFYIALQRVLFQTMDNKFMSWTFSGYHQRDFSLLWILFYQLYVLAYTHMCNPTLCTNKKEILYSSILDITCGICFNSNFSSFRSQSNVIVTWQKSLTGGVMFNLYDVHRNTRRVFLHPLSSTWSKCFTKIISMMCRVFPLTWYKNNLNDKVVKALLKVQQHHITRSL